MARKRRLEEILLSEGLLDAAQLETARAEQARTKGSLGRVLIELGMVTEGALVAALAKQIGLPFVDLGDVQIDPVASSAISENLCRRYSCIPIAYEDNKIVVAMSDPANVLALDDIRTITGLEVKAVVATRTDVMAAIDGQNRMDQSVEDVAAAAAAEEIEIDDLSKVKELVEDAPIVKFVNLLITQAVQERASDIHIEPQEREVRIRTRIDGVLHEVMRSPKSIQSGVISRLKIMSDINIAERRIPHDGRLGLVVG
ncbi:MAG: GspE/PulE family protein [Actinomycetota bacterium]